jgi:hypothetical protein
LKKIELYSTAWSEEDEAMLFHIIEHFEWFYKEFHPDVPTFEIGWLKSLKPNHWKPSEEQMKALNAINNVGELSYVGQADLLIKLYNDLEKL